jgi:hypothetical protein
MTDAPDMIWTAPTKSRCLVGFPEPSLNFSVPYRRADLSDEKSAARIAELEAANRGLVRLNEATKAEAARLRVILAAMKSYLAGEPSQPPVTGIAKRPINWTNDPDAIVEDDEPQTGRDYA